MVESPQKLHCRVRLGTLREFNIKLFGIVCETSQEREAQELRKLIPCVFLVAKGDVLKFPELNASLNSVTLTGPTVVGIHLTN